MLARKKKWATNLGSKCEGSECERSKGESTAECEGSEGESTAECEGLEGESTSEYEGSDISDGLDIGDEDGLIGDGMGLSATVANGYRRWLPEPSRMVRNDWV